MIETSALKPGAPKHYTIIAPILDGDAVTGGLRVNIDIEHVVADAEMKARVRAAEESERIKTNLLNTVSHELRTPIAVIRGFATTAMEYEDKLNRDEVRGYFREIDGAARDLDRLVADLLTMSALDAGPLAIQRELVDVVSWLDASLRSARQVYGRTIDVSSTAAAAPVLADPARLRQVCLNLLDNADKYSPVGERIEVTADGAGDDVIVAIRGHGSGVGPDELDAIFARLYRGDAARHAAVRGMGLGLAICQSIIAAHGGRMWAELPPDGGLRVSFALPRAVAGPPAVDSGAPRDG